MAENVNETVVSVIGNPTAIDENTLKTEANCLEVLANAIMVTNDEEYQGAAEFLKEMKKQSGKVKEFFKPLKEAANKAHKEVCNREKQMLDPLTKCETAIKRAVGDYLAEQDRKRRAAEERARQAAKAEADRRLAEAIALEEQGRKDDAAAAMEEAEIIDSATVAVISTPVKKASGVSSRKDWALVGIDESKVPVDVAGTVIRPVDTGAIMRLIRASNGTIQIPGVTYKETVNISVRR